MDLRVNLLAGVVGLACAGVVASRASSAPRPEPSLPATAAQRATFAASVADAEEGWLTQAEKDFPNDHWSQRDTFHAREAKRVRDLAAGAHVSYEEVIRAVNDDVRKRRDRERSTRSIPCKPRFF